MLFKFNKIQYSNSNNTVIAKQFGQCGITKLLDVYPNTQYNINLIDFRQGNKNYRENMIIIFNEFMVPMGKIDIIRPTNTFYNINNSKVNIALLFKNAKINDYFYIRDITLTSLELQPPPIVPQVINIDDVPQLIKEEVKKIENTIKEEIKEEIEIRIKEEITNDIAQIADSTNVIIESGDSYIPSENIADDTGEIILYPEESKDINNNDINSKDIIEYYYPADDIIINEVVEEEELIEKEEIKDEDIIKDIHCDEKKVNYGYKYPKYNTVSIVIPCHSPHFKFLEGLLRSIEKQTLVPNEVIVVLCDSSRVQQNQIIRLRNINWNFKFDIIEIRNKSPAGANRYIGCKRATSEIIIFTDADDLIHPQRTEIMKYFFDITDAVHVGHTFTFDKNFDKRTYDIPKITFKMPVMLPNDRIPGIADGVVGILKSVQDRFPWDRTTFKNEDVAFNKSIFRTFRRSCMIYAPIYLYRKELSTHGLDNEYNKSQQVMSRRY